MTTERTSAYAQAVVALAEGEDALEAVGTELRTIAHAVESSDELRQRLTDIHLPVGQRLKFVESDVLRAAHPATRSALAMIIAAERAGELGAIADAVATQAAERRERELAEVYVAAPIDAARQRTLVQALERATGKRLDVQVYVDPTVVGGVRAKIGDTVIDGSVARRLQDLRTRVGG
ncbi:ATP synthase F1 subunit delta [Egicoccus sp. AB-alg2]|uniref:ATP synthase F1 subunit delta n=1 Tax=Egicoccus sp. AB-alg2 TaxID=3242693 RepID=UPI00359EE892